MKYNNLVSADLPNEENKSTFYTDTELTKEEMSSSEVEVAILRGELEIIQRALKVQTRRCRQLVTEYTKRLQLKEQHYQAEKRLRDDQLAQVLRALLIFEARLKQEQKLIASKLREKDGIIKKQQVEMQKITSNRYCKKCNQCYNINLNLESMDSSSEYVVTDYHDYQSSNLESLDSSSETYASISEKDFDPKMLLYSNPSISSEDNIRIDSQRVRHLFTKNKNKDSLGRRGKKFVHRKSVDNYFAAVNRGNDEHSPSSNEENTSNDYENLDSLPSENFQSNLESEQTENEEHGYVSDSINTTVIINERLNNNQEGFISPTRSGSSSDTLEDTTDEKIGTKISDVIPVFEGDGEINDNWYASASDQEDDDHRDIYRNNPVLECMNQILMQNLKDTIHSPPKSPNIEKRCGGNKKVKFSDEEEKNHELVPSEHLEGNYYETPTQKPPNYYETPQSIYSNDYEQILSQCSETFNQECSDVEKDQQALLEDNSSHYYIDMDTNSEKAEKETQIVRKSKILRMPPALPPKPANLLSKYKVVTQEVSEKLTEKSFDSEPDYCSISEINLPTTDSNEILSKRELEEVSPIIPSRERLPKKLNLPPENVTVAKIENDPPKTLLPYKPVVGNEPVLNMVMKKSVEKIKSQVAKQTPIKSDNPKKSLSPEIPKLPQVTEIIIPDENEAISEEYINHDNYVKNNTQILKQQPDRTRPIQMGCSVSSLIASFNNKQILSEIKQISPKEKREHKRQFASFENLNELESTTLEQNESKQNGGFDTFDLSQNFEEFNLDECDIEDYSDFTDVDQNLLTSSKKENSIKEPNKPYNLNSGSSTRVEVVRATNNFSVPQQRANSLYQMKKKIEMEKNRVFINNQLKNEVAVPANFKEPTYEHFLECTGLSSKSILTPSRLLSNHKNMLKPKDVKLRSKIKSNNVYEKDENNSVKYWSEPYL